MLNAAGLAKTQHDAVNSRAVTRWGVGLQELTLDTAGAGRVFAATLRTYQKYVQPNPTPFDEYIYIDVGYPQPVVRVCAVRVVETTADWLTVDLEEDVALNIRDDCKRARYAFMKDGSVRFFGAETGWPCAWHSYYEPTWEFTAFPVLPVAVVGV